MKLYFNFINVSGLEKAFGELKAPFSALRLFSEENKFQKKIFKNKFFSTFQLKKKLFSSLLRISSFFGTVNLIKFCQ